MRVSKRGTLMEMEVDMEVFLEDTVASQRTLARPKGRSLNILGKKEPMSDGLQAWNSRVCAGNYKHLPVVEVASPRQAVARDEVGEADRDWIMPDVIGYHKVCLAFIFF